jgi:hypothetical protein
MTLRQVELAKGYEFGRPRGGKVDIFKKGRKGQARQKTATVECRCGGSGDCTLSAGGGVAFCDNDTCTNCAFVVTVPTNVFVGYLAQIFEQ